MMIIRPLQAQDREAWSKLWEAYLAFYETKLPASQYDTTFARLINAYSPISDLNSLYGFCALDDKGQMLGIVHFMYHATCWSDKPTCYLQDLYTDASLRKKGVGRALIAAVNERSKADGAGQVYWRTQHFNHNARRLYDQVADLTPFIVYRQLI